MTTKPSKRRWVGLSFVEAGSGPLPLSLRRRPEVSLGGRVGARAGAAHQQKTCELSVLIIRLRGQGRSRGLVHTHGHTIRRMTDPFASE